MTLGSMDHGEGRAAQLVQLEPLIHQVSGHSSLWVLDDVTVCKPLIGREAKFYRTLPPQMRLFTPEFRGTLKVLVERTAEGVAVAALPPNAGERGYFASRRSSDHRTNRKKVNRVRACNVELASEGEEVGGEMAEEEEEEDNLHLPMIGPPIPGVMPAHNPWLKECHQRYLDKLKKKAESKVNVMECILLENLTHIYRVPNVLDLKMGTRQYGDDAPESKRRSQTRKAQHTTTPRLGVRLAGMQVYDRDAKSYVCKNKYVGRELSEDGFQQTLRHFLHNGRRFRTDIVDQIIAKLTDLRKVVGSLDSFSSLDSIAKKPSPAIQATTCNNNPTDDICSVVSTTDSVVTGHINTYSPPSLDQGTAVSSSSFASSSSVQGSSLLNSTRSTSVASSDSACKTKVDIRLIDFAHATHKGMGDATIYSGPDEGLMLGLKSLINIFTDIKEYYAK
ncbi:Inositol polyphosphate kinase [Trinorchestia longiramus]|nr:Inositol polyphosphate kinase [Trinorchestia longiramus]